MDVGEDHSMLIIVLFFRLFFFIFFTIVLTCFCGPTFDTPFVYIGYIIEFIFQISCVVFMI